MHRISVPDVSDSEGSCGFINAPLSGHVLDGKSSARQDFSPGVILDGISRASNPLPEKDV
jgi:hypothetical protein